MAELLRLEDVCKTFPGVIANDHVDLEIKKGEIHALLGENGAGKTTLMNCVYGVYRPNSGKIFWKGQEVEIHQARDAIALGIGMVHQHFMLVPPLTVAENVILGLPTPREPLLDLASVEEKILESGQKFHLKVDPKALIWQLPVGIQQRVEILKALYRNAELLILDEPTAVLTPQEVEELFLVLEALTEHGLSIIFITHKLEEVMRVCNRVSVLRDGRRVDTVAIEDTNPQLLAKMMVGREVFLKADKAEIPPGEVVLSVKDLSADDNRGLPAVKHVSFEVHRNEIFGIAGVDGNGQTELGEAIAGLLRVTGGQVSILGKDATNKTPFEVINMGVAVIPPDRHKLGLLMNFAVDENLVAKSYWRAPFSRGGFLNKKEIDKFSEKAIRDFNIRTPGPEIQVKLLSGGNQQKVVIARELSKSPDLLIASQPTRGLDVSATEYVHKQLLAAREAGAAILFISTELEEILSLSDRIGVIYEGEIMGILPGKGADILEIGELMAGLRRSSETGQLPEKEAENADEESA